MSTATDATTAELLASADVARESVQRGVSITPAGVRLAAREGRLRTAAITPRGQRLFERADVERWLADRARQRGAA